MSDLEKQISEWRSQMLAAGIKSPVPLEELEIHLREEVERQMKSGRNEQQAFEISVRQIGQPHTIKNEFKKTERNVVKRIGISLSLITLFVGAVLQLTAAPLVVRMSKTNHQNGYTIVDNWWQPQWYAFALLGLFVVGIVLAILPKRKKSEMVID